MVSSLAFHDGKPPGVWGTGHSQQEWRTYDVFNPTGLKVLAISNIKLHLDNVHACWMKEYTIHLSVHMARRDDNLDDVHLGLQELLNERCPTSLLSKATSDEENPTFPDEIHRNMSTKFLYCF